jgi:hypothetical protein
MNTLLEELISAILPSEITQCFTVKSISNKSHGIEMRLEEFENLVPSMLSGESPVVLDGFCNPLELLHFSFKGRPLYLKIYRRRWKISRGDRHYSNSYDFHPVGVKATHEFAAFLKGEVGCTPDEYVRYLLNTES